MLQCLDTLTIPNAIASAALAHLLANATDTTTKRLLASPATHMLGLVAIYTTLTHYVELHAAAAQRAAAAYALAPHPTSSALLSPWFALLAAACWGGMRASAGLHPALGGWRVAALVVLALLGALFSSFSSVRPTSAALLWFLTVTHLVLLRVDCRAVLAHDEPWSSADFARRLAIQSAAVAPLVPAVAVAASTLLMVSARLVASIEHSSDAQFRWLVRIGSLHAPFWILHLQVKRSYSPSSSSSDHRTTGSRRRLVLAGSPSRLYLPV